MRMTIRRQNLPDLNNRGNKTRRLKFRAEPERRSISRKKVFAEMNEPFRIFSHNCLLSGTLQP